MKLIDILVQELPKHGGWPDGVKVVEQDSNGSLIEMESGYCSDFRLQLADDWLPETLTREEYESALSASQTQWNGEGMPPVGCECEALFYSGRGEWYRAKIIGHDEGRVVGRWIEGPKAYEILDYVSPHGAFRPIRSEADQKRKESIGIIADICRSSASNGHSAELIYDAIAAGKIPHIQLK
ncbi:hypothetical protein [Atlantibacter hermannii]|uniref:hypothetical protein n=1 Tax=Atlantibacter hermannii TaxID=565 RepID=UPI0028B1972D|nr:hypothetical protein [Atlantibacter hermannii]